MRKLALTFPKVYSTGEVTIEDGKASFTMSKAEYTKQLYDAERKNNSNVSIETFGFFRKNYKMIEVFPGLTELQIEQKIRQELETAGVKIEEKK
jgi:hypothetical protein